MRTESKNVFLVSGKMERGMGNAPSEPLPVVEQRVVIAPDEPAAYRCLAEKDPNFRPVGAASLRDYEKAAAQLREVLKGTKTDWPLFIA